MILGALRSQALDLVVGEGIVFLVFDERNLVVVSRLEVLIFGEINAQTVAGRGWRCVGIDGVVVIVGDQRRVVDRGVKFLGLIGLRLEAVLDFLFLGDLRLFLDGVIFGQRRPGADPSIAHRLFRIELVLALGAVGRSAAKIVEFRRTAWANLFRAQFGIGQCGDLCLVGCEGVAISGGSLATLTVHCQNPRRPSSEVRARMTDPTPARLSARAGRALTGVARAPGDKSVSHRSLILGAMATGKTEISGLLEGDDVRRTAAAMTAFGAAVERTGEGAWRVTGAGGLVEPGDVIDCGNAGTGARLMMGAAAGYSMTTTFTGDGSLRKRPMARVLDPLHEMGAIWMGGRGARLPITLRGGCLRGIDYRLPMPSAQVKSAVLLAGLNAGGTTRVIEPEPTRDHTERMLRAFGATVTVSDRSNGREIVLEGGQSLTGCEIEVPGDPSSAAFPLVAALITPGSEITVRGVLLNPLRTGLFTTLREMGADLTITNIRASGGDEVGDITARYSPLTGVTVPLDRAASMIDEYPILAIAAAFAWGPTVMQGLGELRVKESDRLALMAAGLAACGVGVEEERAGLTVVGARGANHPVQGGATVATLGDHRIAMSFLVLGLASREAVTVDQAGMIATSFPGFEALMSSLGADILAA